MSKDVVVSKVFRVFISSTFSDFEEERNYLQKHVFPELEELCRSRGALFQPVDLRWGITDEAARGQQTLDICLNEVRLCSEITPRPSFVILTGNRYGWIPIPTSIDADEFETFEPSKLMLTWYRFDANAGRYVLKPRTGRYEDQAAWQEVEDELRREWQDHGFAQLSATEEEIRAGLDAPWENLQSIYCFQRGLTGIPLTREGAAFRDCVMVNGELVADTESETRLVRQNAYIGARLPQGNVMRVEGAWEERSALAVRLCRLIGGRLRECITAELDRLETIDLQVAGLETEAAYTEQVSAHCVGHEELLDRVVAHTRSGDRLAVIEGEEGKSAFAAALARRIMDRQVILRHLGISVLSSDITSLFASIVQQLGIDCPRELPQLQQVLAARLAAGRVVLILDGAERIAGLPSALSPLAHLGNLVVTASDQKSLAALKPSFVGRLDPLGSAERRQVFDEVIEGLERGVSNSQRNALYQLIDANPSVSFARLAATCAAELSSWDAPPAAKDEEELASYVQQHLVQAKKHAPLLTERMFAYIAMGRQGITLPHLMGMLQHDQQLFGEFNQGLYHELTRQEIPPSVLSRLYYDLSPYLAHRPFLGTDVVSFGDKAFREAALASCVSEPAIANAISYYQGLGETADVAVLSELPYLLRSYRGTEEYLRWICSDNRLGTKMAAGLEHEVLVDAAALDDTPGVGCLRSILSSRIDDLRRRPEAAQSILQSEAETLRGDRSAFELAPYVESPQLSMTDVSMSAIPTPAFTLGRGLSWVHCCFDPHCGDKVLGVEQTGQVTLFDLVHGTYSQSVMPANLTDRFMYATVDDDSVVAMGERKLYRLNAPDLWNRGLEGAAWTTEEVDGIELLAMSKTTPLTYAQKLIGGDVELVQQHPNDDDTSDEHIPIDFLMRPGVVNDIAVQYRTEIAVAFRSGAIAATGGLLDETTTDDALMCCCFWDSDDDKVAAVSSAGRLYLFDMYEDRLLETIDLSLPGVIEQHGECICWNFINDVLYVGHRSGYLSIIKPGEGRAGVKQVPSGLKLGILSMAVSPEGSWLALGGRGNYEQAVLNVYDLSQLHDQIGDLAAMRQVFDKEITNAQLSAGRWYFCSEREGWSDSKVRLFSAGSDSPAAAEYLAAADCYAPSSSRGVLFLARGKQVIALAGGRELEFLTLPQDVSGMAIDADERLLAVCAGKLVSLFDLGGFDLRAGSQLGARRLWSTELPAERGRLDAPMRFDGDKLIVCCEPRYATMHEVDGVKEADEIDRHLVVTDVADGRQACEVVYQGFASGACLVDDGVILTCGEGKLWTLVDTYQGATAFMRATTGSGAFLYGRDGSLKRTLAQGSMAALLRDGERMFLGFDEGDICCYAGDDELWLNVPCRPAALALSADGNTLLVLDDGSKWGGSPRAYAFGTKGAGWPAAGSAERIAPAATEDEGAPVEAGWPADAGVPAAVDAAAQERKAGPVAAAAAGGPVARIFYLMTSGSLSRGELDRIISGYMMAIPEFKEAGGQVQVLTEERVPVRELDDPERRLCHLIRSTNTQRYVTSGNSLAFGKGCLSSGEPYAGAVLFEGLHEDYPDALGYLSDYRDILGI